MDISKAEMGEDYTKIQRIRREKALRTRKTTELEKEKEEERVYEGAFKNNEKL